MKQMHRKHISAPRGLAAGMLLIAGILASHTTATPAAQPQSRTTRAAATKKEKAASDTLSQKEKMALQLIESVNNLSRTASKLSETAHEILFPKEGETVKTEPTPRPDSTPTPQKEAASESRKGPYIEWDEEEETPSYEESGEQQATAPARQFPFIALEDIGETPDDEEDEEQPQEGGSYVWVPSSLLSRVQAMVDNAEEDEEVSYYGEAPYGSGQPGTSGVPVYSEAAVPSPAYDPMEEKVIFRGDTINMVLHDRRFGRFDRKLFNYLVLPKGMWNCALTASYGELNTQNMEMFSLLSDISLGGYIFSIKPAISYCIRDNLALGLRLSYTKGHGSIDSFKVDIDDDMNFSLAGVAYDTESYQASFTVTRYLGLSRRGRFSLTNELELAFASGNSDFTRPFNGQPKSTHTTTMSVGVTYSPGLCIMIMKNVSFDLSFGVFGFKLRSEKQTVDGEPAGRRTTSGANFRWNIFNINFGIGVHI